MNQYSTNDPYELLKVCSESDQMIQDDDRTIFPNVVLYDITYDNNSKSSTVIQVLDNNNIVQKTFFGFAPKNEICHQLDLAKIKQIFSQKKNPSIFSVQLPQGEAYKISYLTELECWIIFAAGTSILVRNLDDLDQYGKSKYDKSVKVADLWFETIENLSEQQMRNLKNDMSNRTISGILVGFDSIIRYSDDELMFLGIEDQDVITSFQFFEYYDLGYPKISKINSNQSTLEKHLERITKSDTELEQSGAIIYIDDQQFKNHSNEFLVFKKIRDELLLTSPDIKQLKVFMKTLKLPRPNQFYITLFEEAQQITNQYPAVNKLVRNGFNQLISIILHNIMKSKNFSWQQYKESLEYSFDWSTFQPETLTRIPIPQQAPQSFDMNGASDSKKTHKVTDDHPQNEQNQDQKQATKKKQKHHHSNKIEHKEIYNPTYLPQWLGFQIQNTQNARDKLNRWIRECLQNSVSYFDDQEIAEISKVFQKQTLELSTEHYQQEKYLNVTLLAIGNQDQSVRQLPYFQDFQLNKECQIYVKTLFISLDGMICGLVDQMNLPCQSPYPHICIYSKNIKPKDSTDYIAQTILGSQELRSAFKDGKLQKPTTADLFFKINIRLRNKSYNVYVVSLQQGIILRGLSNNKM